MPAGIVFPGIVANPLPLLLSLRPYFPHIAIYICLMWIFLSKSSLIPSYRTPVGLFFLYAMTGIAASLLISPNRSVSMFWALNYLSCITVVWVGLTGHDPLRNLSVIIHINYAFAAVIILFILPQALETGITSPPQGQYYELPLNLGRLLVNGAARIALAVIILSFVRLITTTRIRRFSWILLLFPCLFIITQSQSRTALLGLAICSFLYVVLKGIDLRYLLFVGPVSLFIFWQSAYKWRAEESLEKLVYLTGREATWQRGIDLFKKSPIFGNGFHADRLMLEFEHMHNSYFHALVQSGALGAICFIAAIVSIWVLIFKYGLFKKVRSLKGTEQSLMMESILIFAFMTERSFFESTGAFYGVDLMLLVPAMAYIWFWTQKNVIDKGEEENEIAAALQASQ